MMRFLRLGVLCLGVLFAACSGSSSKQEGPVAVTGVLLNKASLVLDVGQEETLVATVVPSDAANKNVLWASSNPAVASVAVGKVIALAAGTATITVTTEDGGKTATCAVSVITPADLTGEWKLTQYLGSADLAGKIYLKLTAADNSFVMYQNLNNAGFTRYNGTYQYNGAQNSLSGTYSDGVSWKRTYEVRLENENRMLFLDKQDVTDITEYTREAIPDYVKSPAAAAPTRAEERFL